MKKVMTFVGVLSLAVGAWFLPATAGAQECSNGLCGTPDQSGGGCGCGCGSILIAMTDRGDSYQFADDFDGDGIEDEFDNCPFAFNFEQADLDGDAVGDACDTCVNDQNPFQENLDGDEFGDVCDDDMDGDTILNAVDNCPTVPNLAQLNTDGLSDGGNACDDDDDNDGILDVEDACRLCGPAAAAGCACEDDPDNDGIDTRFDNCPTIANPQLDSFGEQIDTDHDGIGDLCDVDLDGDDVDNRLDNCPAVFNPCVTLANGACMQPDRDRDGLGDTGGWGTNLNESCDPQECYVIDDPSSCLNPDAAFDVRAAILNPEVLESGSGDPIVIGLFTNRPDLQHNWTAQFVDLPKGSNVTLENAESAATTVEGFPELANCLEQGEDGTCIRDNKLRFNPDVDGEYTIKITVDLPNGDPNGLNNTIVVTTIVADVGSGMAGGGGGCAAGSASAMAALALAGLALFVRRKR